MARPDDPVELLGELVRRASVTPGDAGCQAAIAERLEPFGYSTRHLPFGEVSNLFACGPGKGPLLVFLGHTDVVPTGPESEWSHPPFEGKVVDGVMVGRGTADMKGSVAAMVTALQRLAGRSLAVRVGLLLTSDEEGPAEDGIRKVVPALIEVGERIDYCLVGEPSSRERLGDRIRIGRRGSLNGELTVKGIQGHAAYPEQARNPIHELAPALTELCRTDWDDGADGFPPTGFQFTHIEGGTGVSNVIPGSVRGLLNFRYNPASTEASLRRHAEAILDRHGLDYELRWQDSGRPFVTRESELREAVIAAVQRHCGLTPEADTGGGTSDGRFVAPTGAQVVELGPVSASIHKIDEHVGLEDVETLARIYETVAEELLK